MEKVAAGKIELKLHSTLDEVLGDQTGVTGVRLKSVKTGDTEDLALKGCFIAIGHQPSGANAEASVAPDTAPIRARAHQRLSMRDLPSEPNPNRSPR
jgi:thioredoxin reductase